MIVAWYWYDSMRSRETATEYVREFCQKKQLQFLDGSVYQRSVDFSLTKRRIRRYYEFFYTENIHDRRRGTVILIGREIEYFLINEESVAA